MIYTYNINTDQTAPRDQYCFQYRLPKNIHVSRREEQTTYVVTGELRVNYLTCTDNRAFSAHL